MKRERSVLKSLLAGAVFAIGMASASTIAAQPEVLQTVGGKVAVQPSAERCMCARVCAMKSGGKRGTLAGCPNIRDELVYENMSRCNCRTLQFKGSTSAVRPKAQGRVSPNH